MSVAEPGLQCTRMSWEEYLALPEKPKAEWVDGEVVVSPPVDPPHGFVALALGSVIREALPGAFAMTEVGVSLPGNRLRAPDLLVATSWPEGPWVTDVPVLVVEILSPSSRTEDTIRKSGEYLAAGIGQYWIVDPEAGILDVFENVGGWRRVLRLDGGAPAGEVVVGEHDTVVLDLRRLLPTAGA